MKNSMFTYEELRQIIDAIKCETGQTFTPKLLSNICADKLEEVGGDIKPDFDALVTAAQGYQNTLFCVRTISLQKFCFFLNDYWPKYTFKIDGGKNTFDDESTIKSE